MGEIEEHLEAYEEGYQQGQLDIYEKIEEFFTFENKNKLLDRVDTLKLIQFIIEDDMGR